MLGLINSKYLSSNIISHQRKVSTQENIGERKVANATGIGSERGLASEK